MDDLLLYKFMRNETSEAEVKHVLDWIDAEPGNRKYFDRMNLVYVSSKPASLSSSGKRSRPSVRKILAWSSGAAAVILLCAGLNFMVTSRYIESKAGLLTTIVVPRGQRINIVLQDGSDVWLNSGSTFQYPAIFSGKERRVKIDGEAIFNVKRDSGESQFIVETFAGDVKVIGTKFDVVAYRDGNKFSVGLLEGSLGVGDIIMKPGETVRLVAGKIRLEGTVNGDDMLWTDGVFSVSGLMFEQAMAVIEQYYDVNIVIRRDSLPRLGIQRGKMRVSDGIDHALRMLQLNTDFTYEKDASGKTITIK